jgi:hypothetical protein
MLMTLGHMGGLLTYQSAYQPAYQAAFYREFRMPIYLGLQEEVFHTVNNYLKEVDERIKKFLNDFDPSNAP